MADKTHFCLTLSSGNEMRRWLLLNTRASVRWDIASYKWLIKVSLRRIDYRMDDTFYINSAIS